MHRPFCPCSAVLSSSVCRHCARDVTISRLLPSLLNVSPLFFLPLPAVICCQNQRHVAPSTSTEGTTVEDCVKNSLTNFILPLLFQATDRLLIPSGWNNTYTQWISTQWALIFQQAMGKGVLICTIPFSRNVWANLLFSVLDSVQKSVVLLLWLCLAVRDHPVAIDWINKKQMQKSSLAKRYGQWWYRF